MKSLKQNGIAVTVFMALTIGIALAPATAQAQTATFMRVDGIPGSSAGSTRYARVPCLKHRAAPYYP